MKFLVDNNLPPSLARALNELSSASEIHVEKVIPLRERFPSNTADVVWLTELAAEGGWNIVSGDNFRKSTAERELMRRAGFNVFCTSEILVQPAILAKGCPTGALVATNH